MMNDPQLITLSLVPSLIIADVKNDTFIKGRIEKTTSENAEAWAFNVQAGDDEHHEHKIMGSIVQAAEAVRSRIADIVSPSIRFNMETESTALDVDFDNDKLTLKFYASSRINPTLPDTMARLMQRFIVHRVLADWYLPFNSEQSSLYLSYAAEDMTAFLRTFNRVPPTMPPIPYARRIRPSAKNVTLTVGQTAEIVYDLFPPRPSDIIVSHRKPTISDITHNPKECRFTVTATYPGHEVITLFSKHDDTVVAKVHLTVTNEAQQDE